MKLNTILLALSSALLFAACGPAPTAPVKPGPVTPDPIKPAAGSLDSSFGTAGKSLLPTGGTPPIPYDFNFSESIRSLKILPSGEIVTAECRFASDRSFAALGLYSSSGTELKNKSLSEKGDTRNCLTALELGPGGQIYSAGTFAQGANFRPGSLGRANSALELTNQDILDADLALKDTSSAGIRALAFDAAGNLYAAGYGIYADVYHAVVLKFKPDGSLDKSFGTSGVVKSTLGTGKSADARAITVSNGQVYLAANVYDPADKTQSLNIVSVSVGGELGVPVVQKFGNPRSFPLTMTSSGDKVVAGGYTIDSSGKYSAALQVLGGSSLAIPNSGGVNALLSDAQGRLIAVGNTYSAATDQDCFVTRLNPDLTPDSSFGTGGTVTLDVAGSEDICFAGALDAQGRIVVGGYSRNTKANPVSHSRLLARFNP